MIIPIGRIKARAHRQGAEDMDERLTLLAVRLCLGGFAVEVLEKAAEHKYTARTIRKDPPPKYKYTYGLPGGGIVHRDQIEIGAKFRYGSGKDRGHYEIIGKQGNYIEIKHDESDHKGYVTFAQLREMIHSNQHEIGEKPHEKTARLKKLLAGAKAEGTPEQVQRLQQRLDQHLKAYGDSAEHEAGHKHPMAEEKRVQQYKPKGTTVTKWADPGGEIPWRPEQTDPRQLPKETKRIMKKAPLHLDTQNKMWVRSFHPQAHYWSASDMSPQEFEHLWGSPTYEHWEADEGRPVETLHMEAVHGASLRGDPVDHRLAEQYGVPVYQNNKTKDKLGDPDTWHEYWGWSTQPPWDGVWNKEKLDDPDRYNSTHVKQAAQKVSRLAEMRKAGKLPRKVYETLALFAVTSRSVKSPRHEAQYKHIAEWLNRPPDRQDNASLLQVLYPLGRQKHRAQMWRTIEDKGIDQLMEGVKKFKNDGASFRTWLLEKGTFGSLGTAKVSFILQLLGYQDVACVDRRLLRNMTDGSTDTMLRMAEKFKSPDNREDLYAEAENVLKRSQAYKESDPPELRMCLAQWRMWNAVEPDQDTHHQVLWDHIAQITGVQEFKKALAKAMHLGMTTDEVIAAALDFTYNYLGADGPALLDAIPVLEGFAADTLKKGQAMDMTLRRSGSFVVEVLQKGSFGVEVVEERPATLLLGMFSVPLYRLSKGGAHKYKMRVRTKHPPPKYRYYYDVPKQGVVHTDTLHEGAKFVYGHGDQRGHFEITKVHPNGSVTIKHDVNKNDVRTVTPDQLRDLLHHEAHEIGQQVSQRGSRLLRDYEAALEHGREYHKEARRKDLMEHIQRHGDKNLLDEITSLESRVKAKLKEKESSVAKVMAANNPELTALERKAETGKLEKAEIDKLGRIRKKPLAPNISVALSPTKKHSFHVEYKVVDLADLITSHKLSGSLNEAYDQDLQSRHRGRLADAEQIATMAAGLEPMALLYDSRRTDEGTPIIGGDRMVESGNGRTMAMMLAAQNNNEAWQLYQDELKDAIQDVGLHPDDLKGKKHPVLVRERITGDGNKPFRVEFAELANTSSIKRMSAFEEAQRDAKQIDSNMLADLKADEDEGIDAALSRAANKKIAMQYLGSMSGNEAAALTDEHGELSRHGRERFKAALYLYALPGEAGKTIAKTFVETSDHDLRNFDAAFSRSLPQLAKIRAMFNDGDRDPKLDLMPDFARAIEKLDQLKRSDMPLEAYLRQPDMFAKQTTDLQDKMMSKINELKRSPKKLKQLITAYTDTVQSMPDPKQVSMFGGAQGPTNKADLWSTVLRKYEKQQAPEKPAQGGLF